MAGDIIGALFGGGGASSSVLGNMLKTGTSGSLNAGFGGADQNLFQNMLGKDTALGKTLGGTLDNMDKSGSLLKTQPSSIPDMAVQAQSPLIQFLTRRVK